MKGILLNLDNDFDVRVKRDASGKIVSGLTVGDSKMQNAFVVLSCAQGELKEDPIAGYNRIRNIRSKLNNSAIQKQIRIALMRVGLNVDDLKSELEIMIKN